ncbi:hypothetical protein RX327_24205 [Bradyrhizobium sp. BEA-2-5]|uniref:hypothetical protein n=1 Tax=Bradyrhizobium sp. BEA-2-5 TaxID=3080015 RepID=UPI00293EC55A|nr:hypothetical protein [Bradyrhizobium sp. BEA-2-5]WOH79007.1 hypothetical protein RX327_24205 [Bradyrhizobium sp. BEA-2-5]
MDEYVSPAEWIARSYADADMPIEQARDLVIIRCLQAGDATVFSYFVLAGHQPGTEVMRALAFMTATSVPAEIAAALPFDLVSRRRLPAKAGKRYDPLITMRDELLALNVRANMNDGLSRDAAAAAVAEMVSEKSDMKEGRSRKSETVLQAYKRHAASLGK